MSNELVESILIKNLDMAKLIFAPSVVQQVSSWITTSYHHSLMISQMLLLPTQKPTTFYTMPAIKTSLGISSRLVQIVSHGVISSILVKEIQR